MDPDPKVDTLTPKVDSSGPRLTDAYPNLHKLPAQGAGCAADGGEAKRDVPDAGRILTGGDHGCGRPAGETTCDGGVREGRPGALTVDRIHMTHRTETCSAGSTRVDVQPNCGHVNTEPDFATHLL